jgi:hypothetical protein
VPINELRSQWEAQKAAQTSFRKCESVVRYIRPVT